MNVAATTILVLALALFLQACVGGCSRNEAPEFSGAEEQITRNDVIADMGEPLETIMSEDGRRIDIYEYDQLCGAIVVMIIPIVAVPDQMLTVEYGPDDSFLTAQVWPQAETPEQVIASYKREAERQKYQAERRAALEACDLSFSEVTQLDARTQYNLGTICPTVSGGDFYADPLRWQRTCLAAHGRYPHAQRRMGSMLFSRGETVQAYKWFKLGILSDGEGSVTYLSKNMTPDQIVEAERLVAEWEPSPAECETIGTQAEN